MGINSMGKNVANIANAQMSNNSVNTEVNTAKAQEMAGQQQVEGQEESATTEEGHSYSEGNTEEGSATATENAVHGKSGKGSEGGSGEGSQGQEHAGTQHGVEKETATGTMQNVKGTAPAKKAEAILAKTDATVSDIDGVKSLSNSEVIDFSRPQLEEPTKKLSTAELLMYMVKLNSDSLKSSVQTQTEAIKTKTESRLMQLREQAKEMQEYYDKVRQSQKSPFLLFFQAIGALFSGKPAEAGALMEQAWENGKAQIIGFFVGIASLVITACTAGAGLPLALGILALAVGTILTDPAIMGEIITACGVDKNSDFGKKLISVLTIVASVISTALSLGASGAGAIKSLGKGLVNLMKGLGKKMFKKSGESLKNVFKEAGSKISDNMALRQMKIEKNASHSAKTVQIGEHVNTGLEISEGVTQTGIDVTRGIRESEGYAAKSRAEKIAVILDSQQVDSEKSDAITEKMFESYRAMVETLFGAITSLNTAYIGAARA